VLTTGAGSVDIAVSSDGGTGHYFVNTAVSYFKVKGQNIPNPVASFPPYSVHLFSDFLFFEGL
jgi:hypothetical protein